MTAELVVVGLGRMPYGEALTLQRTLAERRITGEADRDLLLLVEHPPVITLGRGFHAQHLPTPREFLDARGIEVFDIERGGDVTFHGPGQLVAYPIFDLTAHRKDLHWFLRRLEAALMHTLDGFGLQAERNPGLTGVWVGPRKIGSIGIHVKRWVTWHGVALNVTTDLSYFDLIVPCGIPDVQMTSIQRELGERAPRDLWNQAAERMVLGFAETFSLQPQFAAVEEVLDRRIGA